MLPTVRIGLLEEAIVVAAHKIGCGAAEIKAVAEVESSGCGFNSDGTCRILFEGHHFHRYTKGAFDKHYPHLSYAEWTRKYYGKNQVEEWKRFNQAFELSADAALLSTSWGRFQIMGFNHTICGYTWVRGFVADMKENENNHLKAFVEFVIQKGLSDEIRDHRWEDFARLYNGPGWRLNNYAEKLEAAYQKYSAGGNDEKDSGDGSGRIYRASFGPLAGESRA